MLITIYTLSVPHQSLSQRDSHTDEVSASCQSTDRWQKVLQESCTEDDTCLQLCRSEWPEAVDISVARQNICSHTINTKLPNLVDHQRHLRGDHQNNTTIRQWKHHSTKLGIKQKRQCLGAEGLAISSRYPQKHIGPLLQIP